MHQNVFDFLHALLRGHSQFKQYGKSVGFDQTLVFLTSVFMFLYGISYMFILNLLVGRLGQKILATKFPNSSLLLDSWVRYLAFSAIEGNFTRRPGLTTIPRSERYHMFR